MRRSEGCARSSGIKTTQVSGIDVDTGRDHFGKYSGGTAAGCGSAAAQAVDGTAVVDGTHSKRRGIVCRAVACVCIRSAIARGENRKDACYTQYLQVGFKIDITTRG